MYKENKERVDTLIFRKGLSESREKALRLVLAGEVYVDGKQVPKPSIKISVSKEIEIKKKFLYVGKGAQKIETAYKEFNLIFKNKVIVDVGSSTGGFTDFALSKEAKKVYCVDVGYGQLDSKLRNDDRVIVMERTDIRAVEMFSDKIDLFLIDVSFISLEKILLKIREIIVQQNYRAKVVALVKPQFEVGKKVADRYKGVIKEEDIQLDMVRKVEEFSQSLGFTCLGYVKSALKGHKGNQEYLLYLNYK